MPFRQATPVDEPQARNIVAVHDLTDSLAGNRRCQGAPGCLEWIYPLPMGGTDNSGRRSLAGRDMTITLRRNDTGLGLTGGPGFVGAGAESSTPIGTLLNGISLGVAETLQAGDFVVPDFFDSRESFMM